MFYGTKHRCAALNKQLTTKHKEEPAEDAKLLAKRMGGQREIPGTLPKTEAVLSAGFYPQPEPSKIRFSKSNKIGFKKQNKTKVSELG